MRKTFEILEEISNTSGTNKKMELLSKLKNNEFAKFYLDTAFNPYLVYGVAKVEHLTVANIVPSLSMLSDLRDKLTKRELTGDKAKLQVSISCSTENKLANKWLKAMWEKNPRLGISSKSINKVFPNFIPKFSLHFCNTISDKSVVDENWIVQPKYNGLRCVFVIENHKLISVLSRNGKELFNIDHIGEAFTKRVENGVIDGEIEGVDWNESISVAKSSKTEKFSKNVVFKAFDFIPLAEWKSKVGILPLRKRLDILSSILAQPTSYALLVPTYPIKSKAEAWEKARLFLDRGFEGAVAKNLDFPYVFDYSDDWLKIKFKETYDVTIVDFKEGAGKFKGMLGKFICKMDDGTIVGVGGGLSDIQRKMFWRDRNKMVDKVIEVECQSKTKDGSLLFPEFVKIREDK